MNTRATAKLLLISCLLWGIADCAWAQRSPYALDLRAIKGDDENKMVSLRNKNSTSIIWTRKVYSPKVTWSKDRRAVAIEGISRLLVWREGFQLRDFGVPAGRDYFMGCVWSPDKHRLLVRCGSSGSSMVGDNGAGSLFCLKLGPKKFYKYTPIAGSVLEMKWRDNRTVLYEALDFNAKGEDRIKSYVWYVS